MACLHNSFALTFQGFRSARADVTAVSTVSVSTSSRSRARKGITWWEETTRVGSSVICVPRDHKRSEDIRQASDSICSDWQNEMISNKIGHVSRDYGRSWRGGGCSVQEITILWVRFEVFTAMTMKNGVFWDVDISSQRASVASCS
jgi:hypothetical protein